MTEDLNDNLPDQAAALIFHIDGEISIAIPSEAVLSDKAGSKTEMPTTVLAATELLLRLTEGDMSIEALADDFRRRVAT